MAVKIGFSPSQCKRCPPVMLLSRAQRATLQSPKHLLEEVVANGSHLSYTSVDCWGVGLKCLEVVLEVFATSVTRLATAAQSTREKIGPTTRKVAKPTQILKRK